MIANSKTCNIFYSKRGIRQGKPTSPTFSLFVLNICEYETMNVNLQFKIGLNLLGNMKMYKVVPYAS